MRKFTYFYSLLLTALFLLPWSGVKAEQLNESFENTTFAPDGWTTNHSGGTSYAWERTSSGSGGYGTYCAYVRYGSSGKTTENYLITPQLHPQSGEKLVFYTKQQYDGNTTFTIEVSTTTAATSAFTTTLFTYTDAGATTSTWAKQEVDLASYVDQDIYIAFHVVDVYGFSIYIDDVSGVTLKPESCPKPGTPEASDVTTTTATISWTQGGTEDTWNLRYKKSTTSVWTEVTGLTSTSYDLTGLTAGKTTYNYEVQADCGGGDNSDWKAGTDFQTECGLIATLPWNSDDAIAGAAPTNSMPSCWEELHTTGYDAPYAVSSTSNLRFYGNNNKTNNTRRAIVILPKFTTDIKNLKVRITYSTGSTGDGYPGFQIGYIKADEVSDASKFHALTSTSSPYRTTSTSTFSTSDFVNLSSAEAGSYIAICFTNSTTTSTSLSVTDRYGYIKKIEVESNIDCSKPATPVASDITGTSAHVAWTANAGVTSYKYIYQTSGSAAPDETAWESATTISANSVDLTGLTDGQAYDFYVMCACGTEASDPCTFISSSCPTVTDTWLSEQTYSSVKVSCVLSIADKKWDLQKSVDNGAWESVATEIADAYKAVAVEVGHSYAFQVKPSCGSDWTDAGSFEPAYPIPGTPSVTPAETSASVTWTAADGADGYEYVLMPGTTAASWTGAKNATSPLALNELTDGTNYTVYVRAKYGEGRSAEVSKNFTTATIAPAFTSAAATIEGTTATVALNEYTGTATKFQYVVMNGTAAANWTSATLIDKTESLVISSGLSVGNSYTVYVRAYYSATIQSAADSKLFEIACEAETLPFSYGFEDASLSGCWKTLRTNENYNLPVISSADKYGESGNSLRFYGSTSQKAVVVLPQFETSIDQLILSFYYKNASTASSRPQFKVGYVTNPDNASTFVEKKSLTRETSWTATGDIDFSKFDGIPAGAYMAIAYTGGSTDAAGYIDDIEVTDVPACEAPTDLKVMTVGATSARFFWTSTETSWKLQYKAEGDADWSEVSVNTNPFDLTGLTIATNYQAKIQSACGSAFTDAVEFTTWCNLDDAANLPLEEDFTAGTKPACFEFLSTTEYPQITSNKIWFQGTNKQIVVLPSFDIELNKLSLKFDFSVNYAVFEFGYFTTDGSEFQSLGIATESGKEIDLSTTSAPDAAGYLAIRYNYASSPYASGSVDNIRVRKTPTCLKPTNLDATPGVGSLNISWTAGTETAWNLQYKTGSADWTTVPVTENPYLLSGLEQGVSYTVHVQADCGGEQSDWSDEAQFTTKCATIDALPFIADFSQALSSCWKTYAATSYNIYIYQTKN